MEYCKWTAEHISNKKDNGEIKIKAQKSGSVKLQAKQGKKKLFII